jgi:hypothetical protein
MAHVYPQDRGQNYSLALGERMAAMMLDDEAKGRDWPAANAAKPGE